MFILVKLKLKIDYSRTLSIDEPQYHPAERALTSDLSLNSFTMFVYEKKSMLWTENSDLTLIKKFLIDKPLQRTSQK